MPCGKVPRNQAVRRGVALLPFYVTEVFHAGAWAMGALRTADAVDALIMAADPTNSSCSSGMVDAVGLR